MATPMRSPARAGYPALRLRFRAYIKDAIICLAVFVLGGIIAGIVFENSPSARIAAFLIIGVIILGYEPFMIARYGATFGHRSVNIRVVRAKTGAPLPFWRAALRAFVKWFF